jgi:hypothetical protein
MSHYAENEKAMLDTNGLIVEHGIQPPHTLFSEAKLSKLYGNKVTWSRFNDAIDTVFTSNEHGCPSPADEATKLNAPHVCVQLASLGGSYEPTVLHCRGLRMLMGPMLRWLLEASRRTMMLTRYLRQGYRKS